MNKTGIWARLRALATEPASTDTSETEKGMAIVALKAAYAFLLKTKQKKSRVGQKPTRRGQKSMDNKDGP